MNNIIIKLINGETITPSEIKNKENLMQNLNNGLFIQIINNDKSKHTINSSHIIEIIENKNNSEPIYFP